MAVNVSNEFHRTSTKPIDDSLVLTKQKMKTMNVNLMPEKYFAVCEDDGCFYLYDKSLTPSAETGKFVKLDESQTAMFIEALPLADFDNLLIPPVIGFLFSILSASTACL